MNTVRTLLVILGLALASNNAVSSPGEYEEQYLKRGPMPFSALDLNRDGVITAEEHEKVRSERHKVRAQHGFLLRNAANAPTFEQIDKDSDGYISRNELSRWQALRQGKR